MDSGLNFDVAINFEVTSFFLAGRGRRQPGN